MSFDQNDERCCDATCFTVRDKEVLWKGFRQTQQDLSFHDPTDPSNLSGASGAGASRGLGGDEGGVGGQAGANEETQNRQ